MIDSTCFPAAEQELRDAFVKVQGTAPILALTAPVGSAYMFGIGTDLDISLHVNPLRLDKDEVRTVLEAAGYKYTGNQDQYGGVSEDTFMTYRKGDVNVIYSDDAEFHYNMMNCSEVVKYLNTQGMKLNKEQRVKLFRIVMNEESAE